MRLIFNTNIINTANQNEQTFIWNKSRKPWKILIKQNDRSEVSQQRRKYLKNTYSPTEKYHIQKEQHRSEKLRKGPPRIINSSSTQPLLEGALSLFEVAQSPFKVPYSLFQSILLSHELMNTGINNCKKDWFTLVWEQVVLMEAFV